MLKIDKGAQWDHIEAERHIKHWCYKEEELKPVQRIDLPLAIAEIWTSSRMGWMGGPSF